MRIAPQLAPDIWPKVARDGHVGVLDFDYNASAGIGVFKDEIRKNPQSLSAHRQLLDFEIAGPFVFAGIHAIVLKTPTREPLSNGLMVRRRKCLAALRKNFLFREFSTCPIFVSPVSVRVKRIQPLRKA